MPQRFIKKNTNKKLIRPIIHNIPVKAENKNNEVNEQTEMNNIEKLKSIVGEDAQIPKRKVKVEKKDKGLIERTEDSTILITEDNKMMLND